MISEVNNGPVGPEIPVVPIAKKAAQQAAQKANKLKQKTSRLAKEAAQQAAQKANNLKQKTSRLAGKEKLLVEPIPRPSNNTNLNLKELEAKYTDDGNLEKIEHAISRAIQKLAEQDISIGTDFNCSIGDDGKIKCVTKLVSEDTELSTMNTTEEDLEQFVKYYLIADIINQNRQANQPKYNLKSVMQTGSLVTGFGLLLTQISKAISSPQVQNFLEALNQLFQIPGF